MGKLQITNEPIRHAARLSVIATEDNVSSSSNSIQTMIEDPDADCPFRHSPLYRSIFVYPSPHDTLLFNKMKSDRAGASNNGTVIWPWLAINEEFREKKLLMFHVNQDWNHFSIEQCVHDMMTLPNSCLRTNDPERAKLFYVPHLETMYWHGLDKLGKLPDEWRNQKRMTPHGEALWEAIEGNNNYTLWEDWYGLTSYYWKRKQGADHFFVMAEPCNGLRHINRARGNLNYVLTQRQNRPPIIISQELSATYVQMFPKCATKNIVMPYANTNGKWFNGDFDKEAKKLIPSLIAAKGPSNETGSDHNMRPVLVHYSGGFHGQCAKLRRGLAQNHQCSPSYRLLPKQQQKLSRQVQMHVSTFCPCPAGDSPSARRMNDAVVAGCIPVVLSADYVWPLSNELDPTSSSGIDPSTFSIRLNFSDFGRSLFNESSNCNQRIDHGTLTLEEYLATIPKSEIRRLQEGMKKVAPLFEYYRRRNNMSDAPLTDRLLPDGGAAHALIRELAIRASDNRWEQCEQELNRTNYRRPHEPTSNPC